MEKTRKAKLPSSPKEESGEVEYESVEGDDNGVGGDSSGSEDDDGSDDGNEEVADADTDDDEEEEEDDEEGEEEEQGAERRSPRASPLPNRSNALNLEAGTPSLPGPVDEDDAVTMDMQLGTIDLAQGSTQPGASGTRGASAPPSP